ncbi:MAG: NADH:flavin oxidoreductase [Rubrivivax sp.]
MNAARPAAAAGSAPDPFDPLRIGPLTLRNRFVKAAANEGMTRAGVPTRALLEHHRALAAGELGMSTVAYGAVSGSGRSLPEQLWLRAEILPDLRALTEAVHEQGGRLCCQLTHGGLYVPGMKVQGPLMSASSGFNKVGLLAGNWRSRAMSERDMVQVRGEFVAAAQICREAGFDAVELHMGHGYLLNQFISPLNNVRRDEYGGSAANRARFPASVLAAVRQAVGGTLAVLAKINVADGVARGATVDDAIVTARALEQAGADLLVLSGGRNAESGAFMFGSNHDVAEMRKVLGRFASLAFALSQLGAPRVTFRPMYFLEYARRIRDAVAVPLGYLGGVRSLADARQAAALGFEAIVMARPLVHDTGFVGKLRRGEVQLSGCTSCNRCVPYIYHPAGTRCVFAAPNDLAANQVRAAGAS